MSGHSASAFERTASAGLLVLALIVAWTGMAPTLEGPWRRSWLGHNGARYAHIARNYARDGLLQHGGAPRLDTAGASGSPLVYGHHPPGVSMLVGAVFLMTGVGELPGRLVPAVASLGALLLLARLVRRTSGSPALGATAALLAAATPMTAVYGAHLEVQGPPVLAASLLVLLAYARWLEGASLWPWLAASALASGLDWYGLYAPAGCALHAWATRPERRGVALALAGWTMLLFLVWLSWLAHLPGMSLGRIFSAASERAPGPLWSGDARLGVFGRAWWAESRALMPGWPVLLLVAVGELVRGARPGRIPRPGALGCRALLALLLLPPLVHAAAFPAGMLVHGYWLFGLPFGLAVGLAWSLGRLRPGPASAGVAGFVFACLMARAGAYPAADEIPAIMGRSLHEQTGAGEVVLTNYDVNVLLWGQDGDAHVTKRPEVTYYADRPVRGDVTTPGRLAEARRRLPRAAWFLLVPWPEPPSEELTAAVAAASVDEGLLLGAHPPVRLLRLAP